MNAIPAPRPVVSLADPLPKGMSFTRLAIALALAKGKEAVAERIAATRWGEDSPTASILKSAAGAGINSLLTKSSVIAGTRLSGNWAAELVSVERARAEFFAFVREKSLIGRIPGFRRVPLQTRLVSEVSGFTAAWVGQGLAVPLSAAEYSDDGRLGALKVSALAVFSDELLESVDPAAETLIRDGLVGACVDAIDASFLDTTNAGTTDVKPASITNGLSAISSSGDGLADIRLLIETFPGDLQRAVLIGTPQSFAALHDPVFLPGLGVRGGEAVGIPAIPSNHAGDNLILVDPGNIALGEGAMELTTSNQATVQMLNNPTNSSTAPTATSQVSLFETDSTGIMCSKFLNWAVEQPCVRLVAGVSVS